MSFEYPPGSVKREAAETFGAEVDLAIRRRGVSVAFIAERIDVSRAVVREWRQGRFVPRPDTARRLGELLEWPALTELVLEARRGNCQTCGAEFINETSGPRRYCDNKNCRPVRLKSRRGVPVALRADAAERTVNSLVDGMLVYFQSVAKMCGTCEPEGVCRMASCPLRSVSPLPLRATHGGPQVVTPTLSLKIEAARVLHVEAAQRAAAVQWGKPGTREEQSRRVGEVLRRMSPEQKVEWRRKIKIAKTGARRRRVA